MESSSAEPKNKYQERISTLPRLKWCNALEIFFYQYLWSDASYLEGVMQAQDHFTPQPNDIFLCTLQKSGTTWLKALGTAIFTRKHLDDPSNPLFNKFSHDIVPFLECELYPQPSSFVRYLEIPLIATHMPYQSLPKSIINSNCKLIYLCREPKDVFCSFWYFFQNCSPIKEGLDVNLEDMFESFCKGELIGPFWINMLGYWKASLEVPDKVMFLRYEDMKDDPASHVKKIANFMGYPFTVEEEEKGVVEKIVEFCSFENLSNLQVNATGKFSVGSGKLLENNAFFRKGKKGDWKNLLTTDMAKKLDNITEEKLSGSGLIFN